VTILPKTHEFAGKTALVTGASSGIGEGVAVGLAAYGAFVVVHYSSNLSGATAVLQQIRANGGDGMVACGDLSSPAGVSSLLEQVRSCAPIDFLVNNAGSLLQRTPILEVTDDLWDRVLNLNLRSAFFLSQAVLPGMIARGSGCIVNISSLAARTGGGAGASVYATAKGGINTLTKAIAVEFGGRGVRVNAVSPGTIDTNYHRNFSSRQILEAVAQRTPAGRVGASQEVADVVLFLCSDAAAFIHGKVIEVNGGYSMA
jgi:3-oxoacyl-[acyl-carrier protein] reductase